MSDTKPPQTPPSDTPQPGAPLPSETVETVDRSGQPRVPFGRWVETYVKDAGSPQNRSRSLELAGVGVFVLAAMAGLVLLVWGGVRGQFYELEEWVWLRTGENLFRIAAVGILVGFIARSVNAYVNVFGLLVIGALIIPTKDIMGFASLFTNDDERILDLFQQDVAFAEYQGADSQLAREVVASLELPIGTENSTFFSRLREALGDMSGEQRQRLENRIRTAINGNRVATVAERLRLRGAEYVLYALYAGDFAAFNFASRDREKLEEDLIFLRREGAVAFRELAFETAVPTLLGCNVAEALGGGSGALVPLTRTEIEISPEAFVNFQENRFYPIRMVYEAKLNPAGATRQAVLSAVHPVCATERDPLWRGLGARVTSTPIPFEDELIAACLRSDFSAADEIATGEQMTIGLRDADSPIELVGGGLGLITITLTPAVETDITTDPVLYLAERINHSAVPQCAIVAFNDDNIEMDMVSQWSSRVAFEPLEGAQYYIVPREWSGDVTARMLLTVESGELSAGLEDKIDEEFQTMEAPEAEISPAAVE